MDQITSYSTLQSAVAGMLHRSSDTNITGNLPLFIQLLEAELNDRLLLKNMESDETLTLTPDANYVALPTGYISPIALWLVVDSERIPLTPVLPQELPYDTTSSQPEFYAIDGANIRFDCPAASAYTAHLRMVKASNLSVSNTTNYLLLKRPDIYLYGTLKHVALFTEDDAAVPKWSALLELGIKGLQNAEARSRNVPLRTEMSGRRSNIFAGT